MPRPLRLEELHLDERQRPRTRHTTTTTEAGPTDMAVNKNSTRQTGWAGTSAGADRKLPVQFAQMRHSVKQDLSPGPMAAPAYTAASRISKG